MKLVNYLKERKIICEDTVLWVESALNDEALVEHKYKLEEIREDLHRLWKNYDHILKREEKK